jgi:aminoglycoside phosphotransferase (APT) family kinase protein
VDESRLSDYLTTEAGSAVDVRDVQPLSGGRSRYMFLADTSIGRFVLRMEQDNVYGTSSGDEFRLTQSLHACDFPVARPRWYEPTGDVLGQPFFVMDHIDAEQGDALDEAAIASFVRTLASLHALDPSAHLPSVDPAQATHIQIERWRNVGKSAGGPRLPLLDAAEMWLHQNAPATSRLSVVHGDAGPGTVLSADGVVLALTDWQFAHVGDPAEDWSFLLSVSGTRTMPREAWLTLFEREAGVRMSDAQWAYWEALNLFKATCVNRTCLALFESGANRTPSMAIFGTALHHAQLRRLVDIAR